MTMPRPSRRDGDGGETRDNPLKLSLRPRPKTRRPPTTTLPPARTFPWPDCIRTCFRKTCKHPQVIVDNYLYHFNRKCNLHLRWKCSRVPKCPSVLKTTVDFYDLRLLAVDHDHTHGDDLQTIERVLKYRTARQESFPQVDPYQQSFLIGLRESGIFDQYNGNRLHPYAVKKCNNRTALMSRTQNTDDRSTTTDNLGSSTSGRLDPQNAGPNQNGHCELDIVNLGNSNSDRINSGEFIFHQEMCGTDTIKSYWIQNPVSNNVNNKRNGNQSTASVTSSTSVKDIRNNSGVNDTILIVDDSDDENKLDCSDDCIVVDNDTNISRESTMLQTMTNHTICFKNITRLQESDSSQKRQLTDVSNEKSVTSPNIDFSIEKQTPHSNLSTTEMLNCTKNTDHPSTKNQTHPSLEVTPSSGSSPSTPQLTELEVARIHSSKGLVTITVQKDSNSSMPTKNPLIGPILDEILSRPPKTDLAPKKLSFENNCGLNSSMTVIPVSNINSFEKLPENLYDKFPVELPVENLKGSPDKKENKTQQIINLLFKNKMKNGIIISNAFSLNQDVPPAIPLLSSVHHKLQMFLASNNSLPITDFPPTPIVGLRVHKTQGESDDTLKLDLEFNYNQKLKTFAHLIRSYEVYYLDLADNQTIEECTWKFAFNSPPVYYPYAMLINVESGARNRKFYFSVRIQDNMGRYSDCSLPRCTSKEYNHEY